MSRTPIRRGPDNRDFTNHRYGEQTLYLFFAVEPVVRHFKGSGHEDAQSESNPSPMPQNFSRFGNSGFSADSGDRRRGTVLLVAAVPCWSPF